MDENTLRFLRESQTPSELFKKAFKEEKPWRDERQKLVDFSRDHRLSASQREKVKKLIDFNDANGVYERKTMVIDDKVTAQIEKYHERNVERGIREGRIKRFDPSKDAQARSLMERAKKRK